MPGYDSPDFAAPKAEALISTYFGQWQANGPRPRIALPPVPLNQTDTIYVPDDARIKDEAALSETLGVNRSSPDYYALQLGNHVMGAASTRPAFTGTCGKKKDLPSLCPLRLTSIKPEASTWST